MIMCSVRTSERNDELSRSTSLHILKENRTDNKTYAQVTRIQSVEILVTQSKFYLESYFYLSF